MIQSAGCSAVSHRSYRSVKSAVNRAEVPFETFFFTSLPLLGDGRKRREGGKDKSASKRAGGKLTVANTVA